jgi:ADP-heptose:LPS heptosyltransferase
MADIPIRLGYSRENPYQLLTHWVPDKEPYLFIKHQAERDRDLISALGIPCRNDSIELTPDDKIIKSMEQSAKMHGVNLKEPFIIFHAAVSESKRLFPVERWEALIKEAVTIFNCPVYLTGSKKDADLNEDLRRRSANKAVSLAGVMNLPELAAFIKRAALLVSVNTALVHIASGVHTPVVVLYAQTNPQHTPWKIANRVIEFSIPEEMKSRNEVIRYVNSLIYRKHIPYPATSEIISAMETVIRQPVAHQI